MKMLRPNAKLSRTLLYVGVAVMLMSLAACGSDPTTPSSPGVNPEIVNLGDGNFQFQVSAMQNFSSQLQYTWENFDSFADIDQSGTITGGTIMLRILDADGNQVYSGDLSQGGSDVSSEGMSGNWTIVIDPASASGDVNFRVDSRPTS